MRAGELPVFMSDQRQQRGQHGEDAAVRFIARQGYRVVERNWRALGGGLRGEIDIIAWQGRVLCFIEVKTRSSAVQGAPGEAVTAIKQRHICKLALAYVALKRVGEEVVCRFDVVEVLLADGQPPRARLCANAFDFQA